MSPVAERRRLARAISSRAGQAQTRAERKSQLATVLRANPLEIELLSSDRILRGDNLDMAQWVRIYDEKIGIEVGDTIQVTRRSGYWVVDDVIGGEEEPDIPLNAWGEPDGPIDMGGQPIDNVGAGSGPDSVATQQYVADNAGSSADPGDLKFSFQTADHSGWLLMDGRSLTVAGNPDLFAILGYTHGGSGTNFNIPDGRGRMLVGKGTHSDVNALTDNDGLAVGSRTPSHFHTVPAHYHGLGTLATANESAHTHGISITSGAGSAHSHGIGSIAAANESAHTHGISITSAGHDVDHTHSVSITSGGKSAAHTHAPGAGASFVTLTGVFPGNGYALVGGQFQVTNAAGTAAEAADHNHSVSGTTGGTSTNHTHGVSGTSAAGSAHTHTMSGTSATESAHTHSVSGTSAAGSAHNHSLTGNVGATGGVSGDSAMSSGSSTVPFQVANIFIKT